MLFWKLCQKRSLSKMTQIDNLRLIFRLGTKLLFNTTDKHWSKPMKKFPQFSEESTKNDTDGIATHAKSLRKSYEQQMLIDINSS